MKKRVKTKRYTRPPARLGRRKRTLFLWVPTLMILFGSMLYFGTLWASSLWDSPSVLGSERHLISPVATSTSLPQTIESSAKAPTVRNVAHSSGSRAGVGYLPTTDRAKQPPNKSPVTALQKRQVRPVYSSESNNIPSPNAPKKPYAQTSLDNSADYLEQLRQAKAARLGVSQSQQSPTNQPDTGFIKPVAQCSASIYRDQYILPGDRVTLLLEAPLVYLGRVFAKNTIVYARANIDGSRLLLSVSSIDHTPLSMAARDVLDGNLGIHSPRAAEFWRKAQTGSSADKKSGKASLGKLINPKKHREKGKILLMNQQKLTLSTQIH